MKRETQRRQPQGTSDPAQMFSRERGGGEQGLCPEEQTLILICFMYKAQIHIQQAQTHSALGIEIQRVGGPCRVQLGTKGPKGLGGERSDKAEKHCKPNNYFHFGLLFSSFIPRQTVYIVAITACYFTFLKTDSHSLHTPTLHSPLDTGGLGAARAQALGCAVIRSS